MSYAEDLAKDRDDLRRTCGDLIATLTMAAERIAINNCEGEEDKSLAQIRSALVKARKTVSGKFKLTT